MKTNTKKILKLTTLLVTSLIIATASASVVNQMFMYATPISVEGLTLKWVLGNDATDAGASIDAATCTMNNMKGPAGQTRTYEDPIRLNNTGITTVTFNITIQELSGSTNKLDCLEVRIYNVTNGASIQNLTIWNGESQGGPWTNLQIPSLHEWRFQWEITWKETAIAGTDTITVKLRFDVS
jgi:hypothetical protein